MSLKTSSSVQKHDFSIRKRIKKRFPKKAQKVLVESNSSLEGGAKRLIHPKALKLIPVKCYGNADKAEYIYECFVLDKLNYIDFSLYSSLRI